MFLQHLKIDSAQVTSYVLLPGDPARVDLIGRKLDGFQIVNQNREFRIGIGSYQGLSITVCSTGIGCPSTAIVVEELISAGAKVLIRVGTCGGAWRADIPVGSLVIPMACIRDEGTTKEYIGLEFPAVADFCVVAALVKTAQELQQKFFVGINRTHDAFYAPPNSKAKWVGVGESILSSEMEAAALLVIASLRGVKAGVILAVNADPEPLQSRLIGQTQKVVAEASSEVTAAVVDQMINVALGAIIMLVK
ncbi:MAG: nucleoside phosphorylase [Patescibacteria group bacterium]